MQLFLDVPEAKVEMPPSESPLAKMCALGQKVLYVEDFEDGKAHPQRFTGVCFVFWFYVTIGGLCQK